MTAAVFGDRSDQAPRAAGATCFAKWRPIAARLWLLVVVLLVAGASLPHASLKLPPPPSDRTVFRDGDLYRAIVGRVAAGESYYVAAPAEHRAHHYPTTPAPVFRQPWLAWLLAALRFPVLRLAAVYPLFIALGVLAYRELLRSQLSASLRLGIFAILLSGLGVVGMDGASYAHEVWAAGLIALSLLIYSPERWAASVALAFAACLFRELALPYLLAMAAFALGQRRWRELAAWTGAGAAFCVVFALHLAIASRLHGPTDGASPGWLSLSGLPFVILTARWNLILHLLPDAVVMLAICVAVTGLAGASDPRAPRAALVVGGYLAAFSVFGRPDTSYWGQLYAPLLPVGWVLAPAATRDLVRKALARPGT